MITIEQNQTNAEKLQVRSIITSSALQMWAMVREAGLEPVASQSFIKDGINSVTSHRHSQPHSPQVANSGLFFFIFVLFKHHFA